MKGPGQDILRGTLDLLVLKTLGLLGPLLVLSGLVAAYIYRRGEALRSIRWNRSAPISAIRLK
jgi:hypothetical protein